MTIARDDATEAQVTAAHPFQSTWLAANAGSGKTRVLTDRVARLLLQGVDPQQILCLTYTKAAASEMQNRLFKRLGEWAMMTDDKLGETLTELGADNTVDARNLGNARTLFARAIETPGGLKIQTIHSFCAGLLRRFPLEAGVNAQFQEMEERAAELLRAEVVDAMATEDHAQVLENLIRYFTGESLADLTANIVRHRETLGRQKTWAEIADVFATTPVFGPRELEAILFTGNERALLDAFIPKLLNSGKVDQEIGKKLSTINILDASCFNVLQNALLTGTGTVLKKNPNKNVQDALPDLTPAFLDFMHRIADARAAQLAHDAALRTRALHDFAHPFLERYEHAKRLRGWLDFDDLIRKTRDLLGDPQVAAWVLYRLDGGLRHILVDEAQDTSPAQWDVIRKLAEEFTSGVGAQDDAPRTIFVVGDKKQSIYSFQGADPDEFDRMEAEFADKLRVIEQPLHSLSLDYSFRSSKAILSLVDACFDGMAEAGFVPDQKHIAFHSEKPGRVDMWPLVEKNADEEETHWYDPVDRRPQTHHEIMLARQVADRIADMLDPDDPTLIPNNADPNGLPGMRPVIPGDIMVLVQRRSSLFHEIIRACKKRDLPIAGADRLRVGAELAVRDLLALLAVLVTPEDSLSLATVLRSPLGGWSEKDLFDLAHGRKETHLWETFRNQRNDHPDAYGMFADLRSQVDFLRPYDLLERILTRHEGRRKLLARLGKEAEDGINAILSQALAYERTAIPSLTGFLIWAKADNLEIKRQPDSTGQLIRVMTVHGAKGLEAPIVILPDCAKRVNAVRDDVLTKGDLALWKTNKDSAPPVILDAIEMQAAATQRERLRLLYVALTRAETWLIVAAAGELDVKDATDWYQIVQKGMGAIDAQRHVFPSGPGLRYEYGDWALPVAPSAAASEPQTDTYDPILDTPINSVPARDDPLSPSDLGGAKALPSDTGLPEDIAMARGTFVHTLLERLADAPRDSWQAITQTLSGLPDDLRADAIAEAQRVLKDDALAWIFAPDTMAEVTIHARIDDAPIMGIVDRLVLSPDKVIAVDFKTNMAVPDAPESCPEGILRQMGAYAEMLRQIYPDRQIETAILWSATGRYMTLPQNLVSTALSRATHLDLRAPPT